mmetsp:Transcript_5229/g.12096  ORF Transcript_5229/g.12096 Transcript_5229/m.12096 type:complete len:249 (+) Transcript_5229:361-1107(+)
MRVPLSSAKAWAMRPKNRATSMALAKDTEAKLQARACATMAPVAPCLEKKRRSSASSKSSVSRANTSLSPKAWQGNFRFGRGATVTLSLALVLGRSSVKHPRTVPLARVVLTRDTIWANGFRVRCVTAPNFSSTSGMQKETTSPGTSRSCPQASVSKATSLRPQRATASSLRIDPSACVAVLGPRITFPVIFRRRCTHTACGYPSTLRRTRKKTISSSAKRGAVDFSPSSFFSNCCAAAAAAFIASTP